MSARGLADKYPKRDIPEWRWTIQVSMSKSIVSLARWGYCGFMDGDLTLPELVLGRSPRKQGLDVSGSARTWKSYPIFPEIFFGKRDWDLPARAILSLAQSRMFQAVCFVGTFQLICSRSFGVTVVLDDKATRAGG
jgi:hypothetical protein